MHDLGLFDVVAPRTAVPAAHHKSVPLSADLLAALRAASIVRGGAAFTLNLPQLPPKRYAAIKDVLVACGFVWSRRRQTHFGSERAIATLRDIQQSGVWDDTKRALEFFATAPAQAAVLACDLAEHIWYPGERPRVLEPSAGDGSLVAAVLDAIPDVCITAVEIDASRAAELSDRFADDDRVTVVNADISTFDETGFDGAIMNPPFAASKAHIERVERLVRTGAYVVGIAMLKRPQDRDAGFWLNDHDAVVWETDADAFVDTTVSASCFSFRAGQTTLGELRAALMPHPSIMEAHIRALTRISRYLHRADEAWCNGELTPEVRAMSIAGGRLRVLPGMYSRVNALLANEL